MSKYKKIKKSVTLPESLVKEIDECVFNKEWKTFSSRLAYLAKLGKQKESEIERQL